MISHLKQLLLLAALLTLSRQCSSQRCCNSQPSDHETDIKTVYMILMVPYPDALGRETFETSIDDGHDISPAAYLAVEQINNRTDILKGYKLDLIRSDGGCNVEQRTVDSFAGYLYYRTVPVAGIIGPTCRQSSEIIAKLTINAKAGLISLPYFQLPSFSNYPNAFGIIDTTFYLDDLYFQLIVGNNWKHVAVLYSKNSKGFQLLQDKVDDNPEHEIVFTAELSNDLIPLEGVRESFARVVFVIATPDLHCRLFCLAYHQQMIYPDYQWIFESYLNEPFFETTFDYNGMKYHCSPEQIHKAIEGSLYLDERWTSLDPEMVTFSGVSFTEFVDLYYAQADTYANMYNVNSTPTIYGLPAYDATWALALALNSSLDELEQRNIAFTGKDLSRQQEITEIISKHMLDVNFEGVTGRIKFDNAIRYPQNETIDLFQYDSNGSSESVGTYEFGELDINVTFPDYNFKFKYIHLSAGIAVIYLILTVIALLLTIPAHIINVMFREHKSIKASSHKLNHIIFIGCYLVILGIVLHTFGQMLILSLPAHSVLCNLFPCCCNIGLTLILATVCIKTWRLYAIFTSKKIPKNKTLFKDKVMLAIIGLLVSVELVVNIVWMAIAPLRATENSQLVSEDGAIPTVVSDISCHSDWTFPYLLTLSNYKGLILFLSLVFAILSRKIPLKEFETKNVIVLVYLLSVLFTIGVPAYLIVVLESDSASAHFLVLITCLILTVYICLAVLFLPPILPIIRKKYCTHRHKLTKMQSSEQPVTEKITVHTDVEFQQ